MVHAVVYEGSGKWHAKMPRVVVYEGGNEWSALYVEGLLDKVGDHSVIDERLRDLVGVVTISSDAFLRGGDRREDVAPTLSDIDVYTEAREAGLREIEKLTDRLAALRAKYSN